MNTIARVDETWRGDVPIASVAGEVDASNAGDIGERLRTLVTNHLRGLVIDLSAATYLDSAGINLLFAVGEELRNRQQRLAIVVGDGSAIARMIAITGLSQKVPVRQTVDEALSAVA